MAEDGDKTGSGGEAAPFIAAALPALPSVPAPWFPAPYAPPIYPPLAPAQDKADLKLSDATPAQVAAELGWLVSTTGQNKMAIGVIVTCHRLLLLILQDLEAVYRPGRPWRFTAINRLTALRKSGALTRAVVDEARLIRLEPSKKLLDHGGAMMGDPAEAKRYVAFLRLLVDVAYEARAKYRKAQQPAAKSAHGMQMSVTVGPQKG